MIKHLDLFSGIGGFGLAAKWAGFETVAFCEIEEFPQRVLKKNFPGVPVYGDIRKLDGSQFNGKIDIITGGYPCQPFSLAGQRKGAKDDRHLWPEMLRVITQARPSWVIAENVAGHVTMGLDQALSDLENEGYACRPVIIPACAIDAPHRRDRVWIIAYSDERAGRQGSCQQSEGAESRGVHQGVLADTQGQHDRSSNTGEIERLQSAWNQSFKQAMENGAEANNFAKDVKQMKGRIETLNTEKIALVEALDGMLNVARQLGRISYQEQQGLDKQAHEAAEQVLRTLEE